MNSLRIRLVAWYVSIAAVVVLFIALLASAIVFELLSFEAQQSLATAVRHAPAILNTYEQEHPSSDNIETYLREQLASYDVYARVRHNGTSTHQESNTRPPGIAGFGPPPPFFVRLFALQIRPVLVHYRAGDALLSVDPSRLLRTMGYLWLIVAVFAAVLIGIAWRVAIVVATQTLEPLVRTTRALNRFGDGDFAPEEVRTTDRSEVGALATAFNRAVEQITRAFAERSRTEAEMRQFVADAGHQLRTPLTVVVGHLSAMEAKAESPRQVTVYRSMLAQSRRMRALIDDLITLARLEHGSARSAGTVDINDLCARIPNSFEDSAHARIVITLWPAMLQAEGDDADLLGALCALVDNALKYAPSGPVELTISAEGRCCTIAIADRGPGMDEEDLRGAFDRFYRGGSADGIEGTGLGLPIVRKEIERAGGTVTLANRAGGGLVCTIVLPLLQSLETSVPAPSVASAGAVSLDNR